MGKTPNGSRVEAFTDWVGRHRLLSTLVVVGIVVGALARFSDDVGKLVGAVSRAPDLEIAATRVIDTDSGLAEFRRRWLRKDSLPPEVRDLVDSVAPARFPILDVIVRNTAGSTAVLAKLELDARRIAVRDSAWGNCRTTMAPSWIYHVALDPTLTEQRRSVELNQTIPPNEVDRFAVVVAHDEYPWYQSDYEIRGRITYNRGRRVSFGPLRLRLNSAPCENGIQLRTPYRLPPHGYVAPPKSVSRG